MPITLTKVTKLPDLLSTHRMTLLFGPIPGTNDDGLGSVGGEGLTIKKAQVTIPELAIGHIRVPLLGFPLAFRGHFDHQNRFTVDFYEDSKGGTGETLLEWMNFVRSFEDGTGELKAQYSVDCRLDVANTVGAIAYGLNLEVVWPIAVTPPASTEETAAAHWAVQFSVDFIERVKGSYGDRNAGK